MMDYKIMLQVDAFANDLPVKIGIALNKETLKQMYKLASVSSQLIYLIT